MNNRTWTPLSTEGEVSGEVPGEGERKGGPAALKSKKDRRPSLRPSKSSERTQARKRGQVRPNSGNPEIGGNWKNGSRKGLGSSS